MTQNLTLWIVTEGLIGTENQCLGIADALGLTPVIKRVQLKSPWHFFSPYMSFGEGPTMLTPSSDPIVPPWPDILIAGGRKAIGIARYIKRASSGHTIVCIVQNPRVKLNSFDVVAIPYHDNIRGKNVVVTDGAPCRITPVLLEEAQAKWKNVLAYLPSPRVAVLVGGPSATHKISAEQCDILAARIKIMNTQGRGGLMITTSRRTPPDLVQKLALACRGSKSILYTGGGENPYLGFLAWADKIICTNDSTSMISDAATTGKPIEIFPLTHAGAREKRFLEHLHALGIGVQEKNYLPFRDAARVATRIRECLNQQRDKKTLLTKRKNLS